MSASSVSTIKKEIILKLEGPEMYFN